MQITHIYLNKVGPLLEQKIDLLNDWQGDVHQQVLFTGPNGCGKSTILRAIATIWDALGWWLDQSKPLPSKHEARLWLQKWDGVAIRVTNLLSNDQEFGFYFGQGNWHEQLEQACPNVCWIGESYESIGRMKKIVGHYPDVTEESFSYLAAQRRKMLLSYDAVDIPNIIYLDAEERRWVTPKRNVGSVEADLLAQRWLTRYQVSEDWKGQLESSLIALKTTQLHLFHAVLRDLNKFLLDKEIEAEIPTGDNRLQVKIKGRKGVRHSLDELSAGEHQVLILIYIISRWLQPGGVVLIDEPDLYLHPSLIDGLLSNLEKLVKEKNGQLILSSHSVDVWSRYEKQGLRLELGGDLK